MTKLFTVGPVEIEESILREGARQPPYFRDGDFAAVLKRVCEGILSLLEAPPGSRAALLTASGTAAMEAAVINLFDPSSRVLVVEGGSFGRRFAEICTAHSIPHEILSLEPGTDLLPEQLTPFTNVDGVLMNAHETSTGQRYDVPMAGAFCAEHGILLVVDAISSFLADPYDMAGWRVNSTVISANKGLAVPPGVSFVAMDERAISAMKTPASLYFRLEDYFVNGERGQTPYTPAINVVLQLAKRLETIESRGGAGRVVDAVRLQAEDFRTKAAPLRITSFPQTPSNYLTSFVVPSGTSEPLYHRLKNEHDIIINPSTWGFEAEIPKVCHAGFLTAEDNTTLVDALATVLGRQP